MRKGAATTKEIVLRKRPRARCIRIPGTEVYAIHTSKADYEKILAVASTRSLAWKRAENRLKQGAT